MDHRLPRNSESVTAPAREGLTRRQSLFVKLYLEMGTHRGGATDAALLAGYGGGTNRISAKARASELLRHDGVLRAIKAEAARKFVGSSVLGLNILISLAENESTPAAVRLSAAKELLERGHPTVSRNATIVATRSIEDVLAQLDAGVGPGVIDGSYSEVE